MEKENSSNESDFSENEIPDSTLCVPEHFFPTAKDVHILPWFALNACTVGARAKYREDVYIRPWHPKGLNSLKPFEFEPKTNIGDINSSSSDGADYKLKRISNNEWCECNAKAAVGRCSSN